MEYLVKREGKKEEREGKRWKVLDKMNFEDYIRILFL
jgi:hypothetical protein